jgi:protocatechuate 3,4-dioxygenase alpha subunit
MEKHIPSSSQTVGPFFTIGLKYLIDRAAELDASLESSIEIRGRVLDRDSSPVPDAMLEFWSAGDGLGDSGVGSHLRAIPNGFRRVATDLDGSFAVRIAQPLSSRLEDGREQAPHFIVLVFARGLQRHLISRVYLEGERGHEHDPVLLSVPAERRGTLIARVDGTDSYRWDVILQGDNETVFFAW